MKRRPTGVPCPVCFSTDTWRWHRETGVMRYMAAAFSLTMMTCRACGKRFYTRMAGDELDSAYPDAIPAKSPSREALDEFREARAKPGATPAKVTVIPDKPEVAPPVAPPLAELAPIPVAPPQTLAASVSARNGRSFHDAEPGSATSTLVMPPAPAIPPPALATPDDVLQAPAPPAPAPAPLPLKPKARGFRVRLKIRLGRPGGFRAAS